MDPDGYFYYSRKPQFPHYIYEKTVCGLVDMYAYGGNKNAIHYLERITAWAEKNLDRTRRESPGWTNADSAPMEPNGTRLSENLYRAYQTTGDPRYQELWRCLALRQLLGSVQRSNPRPDYRHAYSHCNTLSSAAMTYAVTSDPKYLDTIVNAYDWFQRTQVYATGGFGPDEQLMPPDGSLGNSLDTVSATFETGCGSWAIFKLSRYLMSFTGQAKYGDWIEKMLYNGIGGGLPCNPTATPSIIPTTGSAGARKSIARIRSGVAAPEPIRKPSPTITTLIYLHDNDGIYINLFVPSEVSWKGITFTQETEYPESQTSSISVRNANAVHFVLRVRIPSWCRGASLSVNGQRQSVSCNPGTWASLGRSGTLATESRLNSPWNFSTRPLTSNIPNVLLSSTARRFW